MNEMIDEMFSSDSKHFLQKEIATLYGHVKRARFYFLYTQKGVRLTDMYQEGGRAILGWRGNFFTVLKNVLSTGLTGSFPTVYAERFKKAVCVLLNSERDVYIVKNKNDEKECEKVFSSARPFFFAPWQSDVHLKCDVDIGVRADTCEKNDTSEQNDTCEKIAGKECVVFVPPFPWQDDVLIWAVKKTPEMLESKKALSEKIVYSLEMLPPALCAGMTRSIYDLISVMPERKEKHWFLYDTVLKKYWHREGPYLYPKVKKEDYEKFVKHCLSCALVISPCYSVPSIVPFGVDKGVFTKLKNNPFEVEK